MTPSQRVLSGTSLRLRAYAQLNMHDFNAASMLVYHDPGDTSPVSLLIAGLHNSHSVTALGEQRLIDATLRDRYDNSVTDSRTLHKLPFFTVEQQTLLHSQPGETLQTLLHAPATVMVWAVREAQGVALYAATALVGRLPD